MYLNVFVIIVLCSSFTLRINTLKNKYLLSVTLIFQIESEIIIEITLAEIEMHFLHYYYFNFFMFIRTTFDEYPVTLLKCWTKHRRRIIMNRIRITFLKFCIQHKIIPPHLNCIQNSKLNLFNYRSKCNFYHIRNTFI